MSKEVTGRQKKVTGRQRLVTGRQVRSKTTRRRHFKDVVDYHLPYGLGCLSPNLVGCENLYKKHQSQYLHIVYQQRRIGNEPNQTKRCSGEERVNRVSTLRILYNYVTRLKMISCSARHAL